eukprot:2853803-Amphidinium_carterae.1
MYAFHAHRSRNSQESRGFALPSGIRTKRASTALEKTESTTPFAMEPLHYMMTCCLAACKLHETRFSLKVQPRLQSCKTIASQALSAVQEAYPATIRKQVLYRLKTQRENNVQIKSEPFKNVFAPCTSQYRCKQLVVVVVVLEKAKSKVSRLLTAKVPTASQVDGRVAVAVETLSTAIAATRQCQWQGETVAQQCPRCASEAKMLLFLQPHEEIH